MFLSLFIYLLIYIFLYLVSNWVGRDITIRMVWSTADFLAAAIFYFIVIAYVVYLTRWGFLHSSIILLLPVINTLKEPCLPCRPEAHDLFVQFSPRTLISMHHELCSHSEPNSNYNGRSNEKQAQEDVKRRETNGYVSNKKIVLLAHHVVNEKEVAWSKHYQLINISLA